MNRLTQAAVLLLLTFAAVPLFAVQRNIVDDVVRMTKSGVAEDAILAYVDKYADKYELSADDIIAMTDAQVSREVLKAVLDHAEALPAEERDRERAERRTTVVVAPPYYPYWADPFYDPFWYMPRFFVNLGFGGRYYRGGVIHYRGGGHHGGGHYGGGNRGGGGHHGGGRGGRH